MSEADSKFADSLISQDALDELLKEAEDTSDIASDSGEESRDLDLVSPEDIEKLLETASDTPGDDDQESELDLISQDDIDSLISGEELSAPPDNTATDEPDDALISQDDIDALLGGAELTDDSDASPVDLVDSADSDDSLISQDDIDALLGGDDTGAGSEADGIEDETSVSLISQDDIDNLLKDVASDEAEEEKLVSQEDIDSLLAVDGDKDPVSVDSETVDPVVSQDDIDKLLNADIEDDFDEEVIDSVSDQVILEKSDDEQKESDGNGFKKWLTPKIFGGVAAVLVLCVTIGFGAAFFFGGPDEVIVEAEVIDEAPEEPVAGLDEEMIETETFKETAFVVVELKDFVVPAPIALKDISYISLNLTLEIVDVTSDPIKGYEPFFRNIIYEMLNKALELQSESRIIEADLIRMIKNALNDALSEGSVDKVSFTEFIMT